MLYKEAIKKVQATKTGENFIVVQFNYDKKLILPYSDGLVFMQSLQKGELLNSNYPRETTIEPFDLNTYTVNPLSRTDYEMYKVAQLLNMTLTEVKQASATTPD